MAKTQERPVPQIIVAQLGARRHYATPLAIYRAGCLGRFYTDAYVGQGSRWNALPKVTSFLPEKWQPASLKRLLGRRQDLLPGEKITAFNMFGLAYAHRLRQAKTEEERLNVQLWAAKEFNEKILHSNPNMEEVGAIYGFCGVCQELFAELAEPGTVKIVDQIDASIVDERLVAEESGLWPDWETEPAQVHADEMFEREKSEWEMADLIIANSEFTKNAIVSLGADPAKINIVPLGIDISRFYTPPKKKIPAIPKINFLYLGTLGLRKGIHYALDAFRLIRSPNVTFTVAGRCDVKLRKEKLDTYSKVCRYIGPIPRKEVINTYHSADVFIFPTISDGFGLTQIEALACGLPVITTPNAGSVVRDGVDGFIVPIRNSEALAAKIDLLASDPGLLADMSRNALNRASDFSMEAYKKRLQELLTAPAVK